ncbi:MAG: NAD-dependent deacylase [Deltaproteobacteria bacterium]|nr:NAD-dependent deacylase [Deltaproteobacteria bacterium]
MLTIPKSASVTVLTGAGISVASGLAPFRGPGGIWNDIDVETMISAQAWRNHPDKVSGFLDRMRQAARAAEPNEAHLALARAEAARTQGARFDVVTQNIDGLHKRAGSENVHEIHGSIEIDRCDRCRHRFPHGAGFCECGTPLRPHVVLFGEILPEDAMRAAMQAIDRCEWFVAVGTSGVVWPAASFVEEARKAGARCINVNVEKSGNPAFHEECVGPAENLVPLLFDV